MSTDDSTATCRPRPFRRSPRIRTARVQVSQHRHANCGCGGTDGLRGTRSVSARAGWRRLEAPHALVAEEVVAGEDVVDLQALGAGIPLADVALEEGLVADHG